MKKLMLNWMKEGQYKTKMLHSLSFAWLDNEGLAKRRFLSCWEVGHEQRQLPLGTTCWLGAGVREAQSPKL